MATDTALSLLSRYEALIELSGDINASTEIVALGRVLARRLKYLVDVFSWRYFRIDASDADTDAAEPALVIDGHRGDAAVTRVATSDMSPLEIQLWEGRKTRIFENDALTRAQGDLPPHFQRPDIVQLYATPRFGAGELEGMMLFSKRRTPLNDLDVKFLALAAQLFHDKIYRLWEHQKRRQLETAYLQQEIMLRESEKLATLGRLSAGMAHEINNPAAGALRNAEQLTNELGQLEQQLVEVGRLDLTQAQRGLIERYRGRVVDLACHPAVLEPMACADLEAQVEGWLDEHGVPDSWRLAPMLVPAGLDSVALTEIAAQFSAEQLPVVLGVLAQAHSVRVLIEGIRASTGRVSEIVGALRSYSHLDQAPMQTLDVHVGLDDTLEMFHGLLTDRIIVKREYDRTVPRIEAYGRELNQVWTNVIDNAVQAMDGEGELTLRTYTDDSGVVVEVHDTGPGIPDDVLERVFDPFFTTKPPGQGAGLGLNISHNIVVQQHGGAITVRSEPGHTCFRIRLPIEGAKSDTAEV